MLDLKKLIDPQYLLNLTPEPQTKFIIPLLIIFTSFFLGSFLVWFLFGLYEKKILPLANIKKRLFNFLIITGVSGLILTFFRYQAIPYFSLRIWLVLLFLASLVWFIFILKYVIFKYPQERKEFLNRVLIEKYLPKRKNA